MSGSTNAAYIHDDSTKASAANPMAARPKPATIARRVPILTASGVMSGVTAIIAAAAGSVATPVLSALMWNAAGSWKYRLSAYMSALIAPATIRMASVAPTRIWFFRSARSTSGAGTRFSTTTNSTQPTIETTRQPRNAADAHPQSAPSLSASTSGTRITARRIVPRKSIDLERFGSRDSATFATVSAMHPAAIAASIQNSPCQPLSSTRTPPTSGPAAAPAAEAAPQIVIARIWAAPDDATDKRLIPHARIVAPDAPWIMRPAMMPLPPDESAMRTQEATNRRRPPRNMRRRPNTSPSAPEVTITAAPTSE